MRKIPMFAILVTIFVSACQKTASQITVQHYANMWEVVEIANSLSSGTKTCNSPSLSAADRMLKNIRTDTSVSGPVRITWTRRASSAELELAEAALAANCLDYADKHFRNIMRIYSRNDNEGYRQRAQIGIDGVRQKRN